MEHNKAGGVDVMEALGPTASGPAVCGPGYEFYLLAERVRNCAVRVEELDGRIRRIEAIDWQSPAGEGFRRCVQEGRWAMEQLRERINQAAGSVRGLAETAAARKLAGPGGVSE